MFEICIWLKCFFGFHHWIRFIQDEERYNQLCRDFPVDVNCTHRECMFCDKVQAVDGYVVSDHERFLTFHTIKDETISIF